MSFNICSLNKDLIELLKPEASRLLGVDSAQLFVEFKQRVFDGNDPELTRMDLKPYSKVGFLLSLNTFADVDYNYSYELRLSYNGDVVIINEAHQSNVFFDFFVLDSSDGYQFAISYLEFRTK